MSIFLSVHEISKGFGARPLFSALTFAIERGERIGLIGPNGAGKSTLLSILSSKIAPDSGVVSVQRGLRVAHLEQVPLFRDDSTIFSTMMEEVHDPTEWESQSNARELISKTGLSSIGENTAINTLSGGWKKKVALARCLVNKPDLILLDEPTNHLDVASIVWLEELLAQASFSTVIITHDRFFLQRVSNRILELDPRHADGILNVNGGYSVYLKLRSEVISAQEQREVVLKNTLRREEQWLRQGAKARTTKQHARIERAHALQEDVADLVLRNQSQKARIEFQGAEKSPKKLIEARLISKQIEGKVIFSDLNLLISPGVRLALMGNNGAGKSTLIRVLLGKESPTSGSITHSENLTVAYFDQNRQALDPSVSVRRTLCPLGEFVEYRGTRVHIRGYLDRFLFTQTQMEMLVGRLSGGEQSRLLMAQLMLVPANLLVLDEPTNDLDIDTLGVLEECLKEFEGGVLLVTHDRYFLDQVATKILAFDPSLTDGILIPFADLHQWETWFAAAPNKKDKISQFTIEPSKSTKKRRLGYIEKRELESMEIRIQEAENKLESLSVKSALLENQTNASLLSELSQKMAETQAEIDNLYSRWAELESLDSW